MAIKSRAAVAKWLMWSVTLSIAPFVIDYLSLITAAQSSRTLSWTTVIEKGQLLLVCAGLGAAGVGDLIGTSDAELTAKRYAGGASVLIVLLAAGYYAAASSPTAKNTGVVVSVSIALFVCTLAASFACMALAEEVK